VRALQPPPDGVRSRDLFRRGGQDLVGMHHGWQGSNLRAGPFNYPRGFTAMSAADELLGRLETTTVKFNVGRGGIPQLTPQDIAAALGMCNDKFGATIYVGVIGGSFDLKVLDATIAAAQFEEWQNRADRMIKAQIAKAKAGLAPARDREFLTCEADMKLSGAKAAMWPHLDECLYGRMRLALLAELRSHRLCPVCGGRREVTPEGALKPELCLNCTGVGRVPVSDRQRAAMLNVNESSYRRTWRPVYEWMYRLLNDAIANGRYEFNLALERVLQ
jgi:hypothetical protein